jgi:CubicO group peptidase (beta-lactamase class C family)
LRFNVKPETWTPVIRLLDHAIETDVFPGAVLLVGTPEQVSFRRAVGVANRDTGQPITMETVFDLASLTKPLATTLAVLTLLQDGRLALETLLGDVLPEFRGTPKHAIQIRHLLCHTAGWPAHRHYYRELTMLPRKDRRVALRGLLVREPLVRPPGSGVEYSDLGFMVLCWIVEAVSRERLDRYLQETVYGPLGVSLFFVDLHQPIPDVMFAASEFCPWRRAVMTGAVSDDNAWVTGGIDGHAGLFGAAGDVYRLLKTLLITFYGKPGNKVFQPALLRSFLNKDSLSQRAFGFDVPSPGGSSGKYFSANTVGHLGFTGASFWMDLDRGIIVILLSNRVHPDRNNNRIRMFRPRLHDAVMQIMLAETTGPGGGTAPEQKNTGLARKLE